MNFTRICLIMFYDFMVKEYGDIIYNINKRYCEKNNIDIILSEKRTYKDRHSAWERLPLILNNIENYDYLIWVDSDAFFKNKAKNIIEIIYKNKDVNFIFSNDINNKNINTGIFIVKNSEYSIDFIKKWAYDEELYNKNSKPKWWDQGVLFDMINSNILDINNNYVSYDYGVLQHFYFNEKPAKYKKAYILHLAGQSYSDRLNSIKNYINNTDQNKN